MSEEIIERVDDVQVGRPLPREAIRGVKHGILVTCNGLHCSWQGLFPEAALAKDAVERHYEHERRSGEYHYGTMNYTIIALLDDESATTLEDSELGLSVEHLRLGDVDGSVREITFPRTTERVDGIVERGDLISLNRPGYPEVVVHSVTETRSLGMPTWTVRYVEPDVDLLDANKHDLHWLNESIARDGDVYCRYGESHLGEPLFKIVGEAEHQTDFSEFTGGASA